MPTWCGALRSNGGLASQLALFQTVAGDWRYAIKSRDKIAAVTPADIQRVATAYFTKSNRTVATLVKKAGEKNVAAAPQRTRWCDEERETFNVQREAMGV